MNRALRVALVAGEASGDILGASLMQAIKAKHPEAEFIGVGGARMEAEGLKSSFPMERLAVMGLVEVLGRLFELLGRRRQLVRELIAAKPTYSSASMRRISTWTWNSSCVAPGSRPCITSARPCGPGGRSAC